MNGRLPSDDLARPGLADEPFRSPGEDPGPSRRRMNLVVVVLGLVSTALTLALVEVLRGFGFDPMLIFADYVFAVGAVVVGVGAGSGYGLGTWLKQIRLSRGALVLIAGLLVLAWMGLYVAAWWRQAPVARDGQPMGFLTWFDLVTRSLGWEQKDGHTGKPFGALGYLVRLGEVAGFIFGGLLVPLCLYAKPYCEPCQRYLKQRLLFNLPAAGEHRSFVRQKTLDAAAAPVLAQTDADAAAFTAAMADGKAAAIDATIRAMAPRTGANRKIKVWRQFIRHRCPGCGVGLVVVSQRDNNGGRFQTLARLEAGAEAMAAADAAAAALAGLRQQPAAAGPG